MFPALPLRPVRHTSSARGRGGHTRKRLPPAAAIVLLIGCGPTLLVPEEEPGTTSGAMDSTSSSGDAQDETTISPPSQTTAMDPGGEESSTTRGGFLDYPDGGMGGYECDIFAQDCPPGEKCMPWANDGGSSWNAFRCSPIAEDPGGPGDPCTVEGSGGSGIDDCELGAMCWDVDPETLEGTCLPMCAGSLTLPVCDDPYGLCSLTGEGVVNLCFPICDPLAQDCPAGQACYGVGEGWTCAPDASGDMGGYGDPCQFINVCDPGLICLEVAAVPGCEGSIGCCSEVCDLSDPQCTGEGQTCQPWYPPGEAPPGYESVGACALPA